VNSEDGNGVAAYLDDMRAVTISNSNSKFSFKAHLPLVNDL
jgi:hypothetical protein